MFRFLPLILLLGFGAEVASIIWMGQALGVLATLGLLVAGIVAGISVFRATGIAFVQALNNGLSTARPDGKMGLRIFFRTIAGFLFMVPGFFSDIIALLLLVPAIQTWIGSRFEVVAFSGARAEYRSGHEDVTIIDGEATEIQMSENDEVRRLR